MRISGGHPQAFVWFNPFGFQTELLFNHTRSFEAVSAYVAGEFNLSGSRGGRLRAAAVTPEFFQVMKVAPALGRAFALNDLHQSFHVAVISHRLWQARLGGAADVLGRQIALDREAFVVLGVMPADFELPDAAEVWVPARWGSRVVQAAIVAPVVAARLRHGVTLQEAHEDVTRAIAVAYTRADVAGWGLAVAPLRDTLVGEARWVIVFIAGAAALVLLVACANIASLLLTRASGRFREFAVRRALGASDGDIARQIAAETLVLCALAGIVTIPIAGWTLDAIRAWVPVRMFGAQIALDGRAAAASAMFLLVTAVLVSAVPLWSVRGRSALDALRASALATADAGWKRLRSSLAVAEIALALVLVVAAVTVIRSVFDLLAVDLGARGERVLVVGMDWPREAVQPEQRQQLLDRYESAFRVLPGVESVAMASGVPGNTPTRGALAELLVDGVPVPEKAGYVGKSAIVSPDYFQILGIDFVAGRPFAPSDHFFARKVAIISESFARRFGLRPAEVVGRRGVLNHREVQIVGVVRDVRSGEPSSNLDATAYVPFAQGLSGGPMQIVIKARTDLPAMMAAIRAAAARVTPDVPLYDIRTFDDIREMHVRDRRFVMTMLLSFGALTSVLAVLGLYAVISYLVHLRTREIGIRVALGATTESVRASVLANGMAHALVGVILGCTLALGLSRAFSGQFRRFGELDFATLVPVSGAFVATAALAAWLPARRATSIDPVNALRYE